MHTQLDFESILQQQAVFGTNDEFVKVIEQKLDVAIVLRDSKVDISGEKDLHVQIALEVLTSMKKLYSQGESFTKDIVYQLLEEAAEGNLAQTCQAMRDVITLNHRNGPVKCKTFGQKNYIKALNENIVTICIGPAGTGKTYLAVAQAAEELKRGEIERIIMSRPAIEAGEERLGFLPGDLTQKVDPYLRPLYDALYDIFGGERTERYRERGTIEIAPLAYMRGRTLNHARVIIDESQNASLSTLKMALTRIGEGSKIVLTGDVTQIDLPKAKDSGLIRCGEILKGIEGISVTRLTNRDVVRNKIVKEIVKAFEREEQREWKPKNRERKERS